VFACELAKGTSHISIFDPLKLHDSALVRCLLSSDEDKAINCFKIITHSTKIPIAAQLEVAFALLRSRLRLTAPQKLTEVLDTLAPMLSLKFHKDKVGLAHFFFHLMPIFFLFFKG
jgi:hypothetical protein